jgi:predicted GIY-YIG superfamily endonuclease
MSHHVYVLWSAPARRFYIGVTGNVATRLAQHNSGESRWTKRHAGSWELVWSRTFLSLGEARQCENLLKRQKHGDGFWKVTGLHPGDFPSGS